MNRPGKLHAYMAAIILVLLLASGCSSEPEAEKTAAVTISPGLEERVEIVFYMLGDEPKDLQLISDEINKLTLHDLNATVKFNFTTWSDHMQRYSLLLSSGQPIDLLFTAEWVNYNQYAKKGAFTGLDSLLPGYAPELYKFVPEDYWDSVRVNGSIYTVPSTWREYANAGMAYREDLRKKYNLPAPDSLENIEAYLEGVRIYEPELTLTNELVSDNGFGPFFSAAEVLNIKYRWIEFNMPYGLTGDYDDPTRLRSYWGSADFIEDMKMFKRWADKGFWSKSALSNKNAIHEAFADGRSVAVLSGENPVKYCDAVMKYKAKYPDRELGYYPYGRATRLVKPVHPTHNGFAVPRSSRNPERALMFYEKLVLDKTYNHLTQYGIEGKHYTFEEGKYYRMTGDTSTNGFPREAMHGWAWRNPDFLLFDRSFDRVLELFKEFDSYAKPDIFFGFVEDYTPYQAERAALFQVQSQYLAPLQAGFVSDVEAAAAEFMNRAESAGLAKIQTEYIRQWSEYCSKIGLK